MSLIWFRIVALNGTWWVTSYVCECRLLPCVLHPDFDLAWEFAMSSYPHIGTFLLISWSQESRDDIGGTSLILLLVYVNWCRSKRYLYLHMCSAQTSFADDTILYIYCDACIPFSDLFAPWISNRNVKNSSMVAFNHWILEIGGLPRDHSYEGQAWP